MKRILYAGLMVLLGSSAQAALPGDAAEGKRLHDANCQGCHDSGVYTRKERFVRSLDELKQQLDDCSHSAKKQLSQAQAQDIVKYLNERFYRFE